MLLVGRQEGHLAYEKNEWWGAGVVICHPGSPGQRAVKRACAFLAKLLLQHPINGLFSRTTWISQHQKGKTSLDLNEARDDGVWEWQWHQLDHMQTICTSLQTEW